MSQPIQPIQPILQFGTSRFLQAHVDLFVSEALANGADNAAGAALGGIMVVQSSDNPANVQRVAALAADTGYPVRIRGLLRGQQIDTTVTCNAVREAVQAVTHWPRLLEAMAGEVRVIVSNTADRGYQLDAQDHAGLIGHAHDVPRSFPAKLLVLLEHRWQRQAAVPLSIFPCELIERNGDTLRDLVCTLASEWALPAAFIVWLRTHCVWANSLVDRIVSEALYPVGAVAEPYALWAIEQQEGLVLPCRHAAIVLTDDLERHERLKLFLLNAGHTYLAERWQQDQRAADETVAQAMQDVVLRADLEALWNEEILPVFEALGERDQALAYLVDLRERFLNPYLAHRLADIAQNHVQKKQRRLGPVVAMAEKVRPALLQPRLQAALAQQ
ncbi:mannitol dehydrogenase family protein [Herbaspirillum sp. RTI4]|uniref:mannitol dehydrogenase family protein n=1 Tax=Herbaspirillum sp. RTI4 TaxID=3048640 RepID=UPI002AB5B23F|nr:mannitol dehydrogenase family protein [Herbaspirillum sp. RTI4]MDY7579006.1 mannitol dehydrogenase family protein [Herbaspirillum sp. RTI4]MEA9980937.1 mannitol dehydrogenase family protein [Herbaspirillum sp. RTI4]